MNRIPYLIIGNSTAAVGAVEGIRSVDHSRPITVLSKEPQHTYSRPMISYLLAGKAGEDKLYYRPEQYYEVNGITPLLGTEAVDLDVSNSIVTVASGEKLPYEKLLIATGGTSVRPPGVKGLEAEGVFTFVSWQDATDIENYITRYNADRAVVIGGGLIGLKAAEALVSRGVQTTIVEKAGNILASTFDSSGSGLLAGVVEGAGVDIRCGTTVKEVTRSKGRVCGVKLHDGTEQPCSAVIVAVGVHPNIALAADTPIKTDRGILADVFMETTVSGIYVAGDASQTACCLSEGKKSIPIFPNAYRQGRIAGINMAGGRRKYSGAMFMNSLDIFGLAAISVGIIDPGHRRCEIMEKLEKHRQYYRKIFLMNDRVIGAIFIGEIERAGIITGLIRNKINVAGFKDILLTDDLGIVSLPRAYREKIVSGRPVEV